MKYIRAVLMAGFGWSLLKCIELLWRDESLDLLLFDSASLKPLFYILVSIIALCQAVSVVWFKTRFAHGHLFAFATLPIEFSRESGCRFEP